MMKEKYISEAALKDEPKKKLSLKIKEGSITPEHFNKKEVDAYLLDVVGAIEETGMLPEDKAKLDALPTAEELEERFGKIFIVNVEGPTNRENREYIADKTYQDTFAALTENKTVAFNTTYGVFFANADTSSPVIFASKYYAHDSVSVISRAMLLTYTETSGIRIESADLQKALTFDTTPTVGSNNPVSSNGVYQAIQAIDVSSQISGKLDKTEAAELYQPKGNYLTEHQDISGKANVADVYTQNQTDTLLNGKQDTISNVTVAVDANTGTPAGTVTFSNNTLAFDFQNLKGEKGDTGERGAQGVQGPRGAEGAAGITGDVSDLSIRQAVDATTTYTATDVAGAAALQYILTHDIEGGFYYE